MENNEQNVIPTDIISDNEVTQRSNKTLAGRNHVPVKKTKSLQGMTTKVCLVK